MWRRGVDISGFLPFCCRIVACACPVIATRKTARNDVKKSIHPEKIALADFHAVMAQDAVGGGGVEVEIREREIIDELLSRQRQRVGRPDRKSDITQVGAIELPVLERLHIVDGS